ncbi:hypothetical protein D3C85_617980 [compost metagenome]
MRKTFLILGLFITQLNFAQNTLNPSGNVGIGISSPSVPLDVMGTVKIQSSNANYNENLRLLPSLLGDYSSIALGAVAGNAGTGIGQWNLVRYPAVSNYMFSLRYNTTDYFNVLSNGNIGIGTSSPSSKLSVLGNISKLTLTGIDGVYDNLLKYGHRTDLESGTSNVNRWHGIDATITAGNAEDNKLKFRLYGGGIGNLEPVDVMTLLGNGFVGIGTTRPDAKLAVSGTIHSKEVKVDLNVPAPDYVFASDYKLRTLKEVETYVNQNSHLPEIPSAKEFEKNGMQLAEMNMALLKKVEELTLYAIEQEKKTEKLNQYIIEQNKIILEQNKRLDKLEK